LTVPADHLRLAIRDEVAELDVMRAIVEVLRTTFLPRGGKCLVPGCAETCWGWGLCHRHYKRARYQGIIPKLTEPERFWRQVDLAGPVMDGMNSPCWVWMGSVRSTGYGQIKAGGRVRKAHRLAWEMVNGPVPPTRFVLHRCDFPLCVRTEPGGEGHLFLGDNSANVADMMAKGRGKYGPNRRSLNPHPSATDPFALVSALLEERGVDARGQLRTPITGVAR
jgi:hypothetical protein